MVSRYNILKVPIRKQPNDTSCGPTCLHTVYQHYGDIFSLSRTIREVKKVKHGGTLAVHLGIHALKQGYKATIYTYNINVFDPTWFSLSKHELIKKLKKQARAKTGKKKILANTLASIEFLEKGGSYRFEELSPMLLGSYLRRGIPIITGLSATYLYDCPREIQKTGRSDDVLGTPTGHFVVLCGYDPFKRKAVVADPFPHEPDTKKRIYEASIYTVTSAIMLGILTHDANILIIEPKEKKKKQSL